MARIGLVLGAGGVVGQAYHAGVLASLADVTGGDPRHAELIVGTSAGAGTAALLRLGVPAGDLYARACDRPLSVEGHRLLATVPRPTGLSHGSSRGGRGRWRPSSPGVLVRAAVMPWRARLGVVAAAALPEGSTRLDELGTGLRRLYGDRPWPDAPTWICAVCLDDGRRTVFGRAGAPLTDIGTAVQASSAIPGYFAPVEDDGVRYVDGGAYSATNLDLVAQLGLDLVIVSAPMSTAELPSAHVPRAVLRLPMTLRLAQEVRVVQGRGTGVVAFQPTVADLAVTGWNAMDFGRRAAVATHAYASARHYLETDQVHARLAPLANLRFGAGSPGAGPTRES